MFDLCLNLYGKDMNFLYNYQLWVCVLLNLTLTFAVLLAILNLIDTRLGER